MTPEQYERASVIFHAALDLDPSERTALIERESAGDAVVRAEVESLLAARERAASFLEPVPAQEPEPSLQGRTIGHYEIVRELGAGGMGVVYEARQSMPRRSVALKLMRSSLASAEERSRFRFEAEVLGRLQHPNIAQVYESGVHLDDGPFGRRETPWFALELVPEGRTIVVHAAERALGLRARIELFLQVCETRSDVYSLGVVLYELLLGRLPFDFGGKPLHGVARIVALEPPRRPRAVDPRLPLDVEWILLRALAKEPALRYTSAPELAADLRRFLAHEPVRAGRPSVVTRLRLVVRRNPLASAIGALAVVVLVASTALYIWNLTAAQALEQRRLYVATIAAASSALRESDHFGAREQLALSPEHLRGWEWRHLMAQLDAPVRSVRGEAPHFRGTSGAWTCVQDGRIFEVPTDPRKEPYPLMEMPRAETWKDYAWSPDGERLLVAGSDGWVHVFALGPVQRLVASRSLQSFVETAAFSPDGQRIVAGLQDYSIHVFDAELAGELAPSISVPRSPKEVTFVGAAGAQIAVQGTDSLLLWDPGNGVLRELARDALGIASLDAGAGRMAWCTRGGDAMVYDVDRGEVERTIPNLPFREGAGVDPLGLRLVVHDPTEGLRVLELDTGALLPFRGSAPGLRQFCSMAPRGERFVTDSLAGQVLEWQPDAARGDRIISAHSGDTGVNVSPGAGVVLTSGARDMTLRVWDLENGGLSRTFAPRGVRSPIPFDASADGRRVLVISGNSFACVWDREADAVLWQTPLRVEEAGPAGGFFDATREAILLVQRGRVERWSIGAAFPERTAATPFSEASSPTYHRATDRLAVVDALGTVALFDGTSLALLWKQDHVQADERHDSLASFAPDGRAVAVATGTRLTILDARSGAVLRSTQIESAVSNAVGIEIGGLAYHPDGTRIAVAMRSSVVRLYEALSLEPVATLRGDSGWFGPAKFSADGRYLAAGTSKGNVFLWDAGSDKRADVPVAMGAASARRGRELCRLALADAPDVEGAIAALRADPALTAEDREAALRAAYAELASPACQARRAIAVWIADAADPQRRMRAGNVSRGLGYTLPGDLECQLARGLCALRLRSPADAIAALERARRVDPEHASAVWTCASAALAIALVRAARIDEARTALADARAGPELPAEWSPLLDEAQRTVQAGR